MVPSARSSMIWPSPPAERVTDSQRPRSGSAASAASPRGARATELTRTTAATNRAWRMWPVRYASCSARTSPLLSEPMRHVRLGHTGLPVSRLCLGTMTFGLQCDEPTSFAILDRAAAGGITFLDTADVYPLGGTPETVGRTEEIVGRWLRGRRHDVVIATKCSGATGARPWDRGTSRKHVLDAIDDSLRALDVVVRAGKARYIGCSNYHAYQVARAIGRSETLGLARFDSVQPRYNLLFRQIERELLPLCQEEGVGVIPYNPLAGGLLSGKHRQEAGPTAGTRFTLGFAARRYQERYWREREFATVEALRPLAADAGMSMVQLAVAWVLAHPAITAPIIGASRPEQLDDVLAAADKELPPDVKTRLDELTLEYRFGDDPR